MFFSRNFFLLHEIPSLPDCMILFADADSTKHVDCDAGIQTQINTPHLPTPSRVYVILFQRHCWGQQWRGKSGGKTGMDRCFEFSGGIQICGVAWTQKLPKCWSRTAPERTWTKYRDFITHPSTRHCIRVIKQPFSFYSPLKNLHHICFVENCTVDPTLSLLSFIDCSE